MRDQTYGLFCINNRAAKSLQIPFEVKYNKNAHWEEYMRYIKKAMDDPKDVNGVLLHEITEFISTFTLACTDSGCNSQMYPIHHLVYEGGKRNLILREIIYYAVHVGRPVTLGRSVCFACVDNRKCFCFFMFFNRYYG